MGKFHVTIKTNYGGQKATKFEDKESIKMKKKKRILIKNIKITRAYLQILRNRLSAPNKIRKKESRSSCSLIMFSIRRLILQCVPNFIG